MATCCDEKCDTKFCPHCGAKQPADPVVELAAHLEANFKRALDRFNEALTKCTEARLGSTEEAELTRAVNRLATRRDLWQHRCAALDALRAEASVSLEEDVE